ncbi:MAG: 3-hydroxyacyl-CoA dehydrogenase family protein, partial [bacterium]
MSTSSSFDKVAVIGLGLMGHGICQVAAMAGIHSSIVAFEPEVRFLDKGKERIENSLKKLAAKGKISDADEVLQKILFTTDSASLGDVDFVVEAVVENLDLKKDLYRTLSHVCKPECIFASNTSSLSITQMAENSDRPDKFVGVHFFNPVQVMK